MQIGLYPGSFKPFHSGHFSIVELGASQNDVMIVHASLKDRKRKGEFEILGSDMLKIWKILQEIMPQNVRIDFTDGPIASTYARLETADRTGETNAFTVYGDVVDIDRNFSIPSRAKYFPRLVRDGMVKFKGIDRASGINISGTKIRDFLATENMKEFLKFMPPGADGQRIWEILTT